MRCCVLSDTGAYGNHALTVTGNTGHKAMSLYPAMRPNIRFHADIVYTNLPTSGAYRGYGVPQGFFALETPHGADRPTDWAGSAGSSG